MWMERDDAITYSTNSVPIPDFAYSLGNDLDLVAFVEDRNPHPSLHRIAVNLELEKIGFLGRIHRHCAQPCGDAAQSRQTRSDGRGAHVGAIARCKDEIPMAPLLTQVLNAPT